VIFSKIDGIEISVDVAFSLTIKLDPDVAFALSVEVGKLANSTVCAELGNSEPDNVAFALSVADVKLANSTDWTDVEPFSAGDDELRVEPDAGDDSALGSEKGSDGD